MTTAQKMAVIRQLMPLVRLCPTSIERDEFLRKIAWRLDVDLESLRRDEVRDLPPLAPEDLDEFLAWAWRTSGAQCGRWNKPCTVADLAFQSEQEPERMRDDIMRLALRVRENQRLGKDPWEGLTCAYEA